MPQLLLEAPTGIGDQAKREMMTKLTEAIDAAYHIPDVRIWLREYAPENVAQDGYINAEPIKPLCFLEAPRCRISTPSGRWQRRSSPRSPTPTGASPTPRKPSS